MAHPNKLYSARILIFGGTSGIGFATASLCLSLSARVTILGSNPSRLSNALERLRSAYPSTASTLLTGEIIDLSDGEHLEETLTTLFDKLTKNGAEKIDHIAHTAGDALKFPALNDMTLDVLYSHSNVRLNGAMVIAKLISTGKYVNVSPSSSFTLTSGVNTTRPAPGWGLPAAWGAMAEGFTRAFAVDLKPIRVNLVSPGAVLTELFDTLPEGARDKVMESMAKATLVGKVGDPSDTAEAYAYLMKDRYVTGSILHTDGGLLLAPAMAH